MIPRGLSDLVLKATFLAKQSRSSEISIDLLLAALDMPEPEIVRAHSNLPFMVSRRHPGTRPRLHS
jgi:hypothetical protein